MNASPPSAATARPLLYLWAVLGVVAMLVQAIIRLGEISWEALSSGEMTTFQYAICGAWVISNAYMEGYRGFQLKFVPRVLARAHHLAQHPQLLPALLAPFYVMAFFRATTRAKIAAWAITTLVILAIVAVRALPQPWRGIVDAGVVVGLSWGTIVMMHGVITRLTGTAPTADPELSDAAISNAASA